MERNEDELQGGVLAIPETLSQLSMLPVSESAAPAVEPAMQSVDMPTSESLTREALEAMPGYLTGDDVPEPVGEQFVFENEEEENEPIFEQPVLEQPEIPDDALVAPHMIEPEIVGLLDVWYGGPNALEEYTGDVVDSLQDISERNPTSPLTADPAQPSPEFTKGAGHLFFKISEKAGVPVGEGFKNIYNWPVWFFLTHRLGDVMLRFLYSGRGRKLGNLLGRTPGVRRVFPDHLNAVHANMLRVTLPIMIFKISRMLATPGIGLAMDVGVGLTDILAQLTTSSLRAAGTLTMAAATRELPTGIVTNDPTLHRIALIMGGTRVDTGFDLPTAAYNGLVSEILDGGPEAVEMAAQAMLPDGQQQLMLPDGQEEMSLVDRRWWTGIGSSGDRDKNVQMLQGLPLMDQAFVLGHLAFFGDDPDRQRDAQRMVHEMSLVHQLNIGATQAHEMLSHAVQTGYRDEQLASEKVVQRAVDESVNVAMNTAQTMAYAAADTGKIAAVYFLKGLLHMAADDDSLFGIMAQVLLDETSSVTAIGPS